MRKKFNMKIYKTLSTLSGILLIIAIFSFPYGYYQFLRCMVFVTAVLNILWSSKNKASEGVVTMIIVAIVFNPIAPIYFDKNIWIVIDFITAIIMFGFIKEEKIN